jgi:hypothetical protein
MTQVTSENLARAHSILTGEKHPLEVFNPKTAPKEYHFWHNIMHPQTQTGTTGDFRAHDIAAGERWPSDYTGRGISSSQAATGRETRYEQLGHIYEQAGEARDIPLSHQMQGVTWEGGKWIERAGLQKGDIRIGQPYTAAQPGTRGRIHVPHFTRQGRQWNG